MCYGFRAIAIQLESKLVHASQKDNKNMFMGQKITKIVSEPKRRQHVAWF